MKRGQFKKSASKRSVYQRRYNSRASQIKRRSTRNKARRRAVKAGRVRKGDGKDLHHTARRSLSYSSTKVTSKKANRSKNSHLKSRRRKKRR